MNKMRRLRELSDLVHDTGKRSNDGGGWNAINKLAEGSNPTTVAGVAPDSPPSSQSTTVQASVQNVDRNSSGAATGAFGSRGGKINDGEEKEYEEMGDAI
jgi:hypothetical protein